MRNHYWIAVTVLLAAMQACNMPSIQSTPEPPPTQPVIDTPTLGVASPPTLTSTPTAVQNPIFAFTSTPIIAVASPKDNPVNCRFGPGLTFAIAAVLDTGQQAEITGKNEDGTWWQVKNPSDPSRYCWLAMTVTDASGNLASIPVVDPFAPSVMSIKVTVQPQVLNISCSALPQTISATADITTNGPATITWRWETSTGEASSEDPMIFVEAGTKTVYYYYKATKANDYWIQVHVLTPTDTTGRATFKVNCSP